MVPPLRNLMMKKIMRHPKIHCSEIKGEKNQLVTLSLLRACTSFKHVDMVRRPAEVQIVHQNGEER